MKTYININTFLMLLFVTLGSSTKTVAQQDAQFTQYMYNTANINPAYAGSRDVLSVLGLYRTQWVGLEGAPKTATFAINTPLNERIGFGLSFIQDQIGPSDENLISADLSYNIQLGNDYKLYFGVKGSANILNVDYAKLDIYTPTDPRFQYNIDNKLTPNVGSGIYLRSEKNYIGLSVPNFLETKFYDRNSQSIAKEKLHFHLIGGHVFNFSESVKFKPAFLTKWVKGSPFQVDLSGNFMFHDKFVLGVAYRWDAAFSGLAGFQINKNLYLGYSYDKDVTKLGNFNSGSHEFFLRFEIFKNNASPISPRFF